MRKIITLKPTADGKVRITRDHYVMEHRYEGGYELYEGAGVDGGSWLVKGRGGERRKFANRAEAEEHIDQSLVGMGIRDSKDEGVINAAARRMGVLAGKPDPRKPKPHEGPEEKENAKDFTVSRTAGSGMSRIGKAQMQSNQQKNSKDLFIGTRGLNQERGEGELDKAYDSAHRRKIVVHNHMPRAKAKDIGDLTPEQRTLYQKQAHQQDPKDAKDAPYNFNRAPSDLTDAEINAELRKIDVGRGPGGDRGIKLMSELSKRQSKARRDMYGSGR